MIRGLAAVAAGVVLLFAAAGPACAQEDPPAPSVTPAPSAEPTPSPSPTPTAEPSVEPTPTTAPTTSAPTTSPAAPTSSSATPSTTSRAPVTTSRSTRAPGTGAGAAAAPGPTSAAPTTQPSPTPTEYSALVPWIPADDQPEILLLAVLLLAGSGTAGVVMFERDRARRNAVRDRHDFAGSLPHAHERSS